MWPFDLPGPDFLILYLAIGALILLAVFSLRHLAEPADAPKVNLADPYSIAFLRGGKNEVLRVAAVSLLDRGLLAASKTTLSASPGAFGQARSPLEQKVVRHFNPSAEASSLFKMKDANPEMDQYEADLARIGLLPDRDMRQGRLLRMGIGLTVVLGVAILKVTIALATGHSNVQFLIILACIFGAAVLTISRPRLTRAGERTLADLKTLFSGLKQRSDQIQNGASPGEFALMAAVFGTGVIPSAKLLFPRAAGSTYGSSCGSSCGSSSGGDSGGSSCGGGGCGGCGGS